MKRIAVLTSGGDSPGMNATIRSVVRCGIDLGLEVYGVYRGYEGLLEGEIDKLDRSSVGDILHRGGTMLRTARSAKFQTAEGVRQAAGILDTFGIEGLCIIGGDGSMRGARDLMHEGVGVVCLPGTIDNDLAYTDYTIGFDTAVNTVLEAISKIRDTSSSHERTTVIEVMGRRCGDIALYSGAGGGAEAVLIPEIVYDVNDICRRIISGINRGKAHSIIINAEGSGITSKDLVSGIQQRTGREARLVVLSYLQRGGVPTLQDRLLATLTGAKAAAALASDDYGKAFGIVSSMITGFDLDDALGQTKEFNSELYDLIGVLSK